MILEASEVISLNPLEYVCPFCGTKHTSVSMVEEDVTVAECCDVSAEEEAFEETITQRMLVRIAGLSATLQ